MTCGTFGTAPFHGVAPACRVSNPPSQLVSTFSITLSRDCHVTACDVLLQTNVRLQLTKMEKELEELKQRVQLTKIDLAREQQVTC